MLSEPMSEQSIAASVAEEILVILREKEAYQGKPLPDITSQQRLGPDLGLTSLDLARLIACLELRLKADPFQELVPITSVRSVGDVCQAYVKFFSGAKSDGSEDELEQARARARARVRGVG
ncbi:MAG: hypothetical protein ACOY0T_30605 [Myxococcota bacterium]